MNVKSASPTEARGIGLPLFIGILFLPYIFAWFLLRPGYSGVARFLAFGWLVVLVSFVMQARQAPSSGSGTSSNAQVVDPIDPYRRTKDEAATLARLIVPKTMKDPASAQFGQIWGMAPGIACGFVNGKNSFGALTGQQRFIMVGGAVEFQGADGFARHWNTICVNRLLSKPPGGASAMRWGGSPASPLKMTMAPTDQGLSMYQPKATPESLEGVAVNQSDFLFDHGGLYAADFYIMGEPQRDAIRTAMVKKFGTPLSYDEGANSYSWKWPKANITVEMRYDAAAKRTTVTYAHGAH